MDVYNICFKEIQGEDTLLHEQNQRFRQLQLEIRALVGVNYLSTGIDILTTAPGSTIIHQESKYIVEEKNSLQIFFE